MYLEHQRIMLKIQIESVDHKSDDLFLGLAHKILQIYHVHPEILLEIWKYLESLNSKFLAEFQGWEV